jgi:multidrug resistance efflux pump
VILDWERPVAARWRLVFWLMLALVGAVVVWAALTEIEVYVVARGRLEPRSPGAVLRAPIAGRVTGLEAKPDETVDAGAVLMVLDALGTDAEDTRFQLETQRARVTLARTGGSGPSNAALLSLEQSRLAELEHRARLKLVSPIRGRVTRLESVLGQTVAAGAVLAEVRPEGEPPVFRALVSERDRPKLRPGTEVEVVWNGYPREKFGASRGKLLSISVAAAPSSPTENPGYVLEISLERLTLVTSTSNQPLLEGLAGEARVISARRKALGLFWDWLRGVEP